jgi:HlyD family secretion protein
MTWRPSAAAALLVFLAISCRDGSDAKPAGDAAQVPLVEAVPARTGALPLSERVTGTVKARNQVEIRAEVESPIVEVYVRGGEAVQKGQPLVRHRDVELREQLRRAEADVQVAEAAARQERARVGELEAQVRRTRVLATEQLVSAADLETLEAQLAAARAGADQAVARIAQARAAADERRSALARAIVRAPVSGWIGQRNAEIGMLPRADSLLFLIGDLEHVVVEIPLTQEMLATVKPGAPVTIAAGEGEPLRAAITRISPFLAAGSRSAVGEIELANPERRLRPGMSVKVDVVHGESSRGTLVPLSALYEDPQSGQVSLFVVSNMTAATGEQTRPVAQRAVEVVARGAGTAAVTGVKESEWVVSIGQHLLAREQARTARVRPATWDRVLQLQGLQREDLLAGYLEKQQAIARTHGAEPPTSAEFLGGKR